ncbi:hypothetical protein [Actinospongicola halichondriae]|uniref:hypothetical protein n=1 Tax=Actinospongicola halichondriae TaxID=3236844 RepID=UPI003D562F37
MSSPDSPEDPVSEAVDRDLRAARRSLVFFVVALAAAAAGFVMVLSGSRGDDGGSLVAGQDAADDGDAVTARIGPSDGDSVDRYAGQRRVALEGVEGRRAAVVSLTGYSTVDTVDDLLDGLEFDRYLVAPVGSGPISTRDVAATMADVVDDATAQLAEIEEIAPTVEGDPDYEAFYAEEIERYRRLLDAAQGDDVVFGVVVIGSASDLRALASRASVRLVDVGDSDRLDRDAPVRGLRPEETATVGEPAFRP